MANSQVGEIKLQHFCLTKIGRKRKENPQAESNARKKSKYIICYNVNNDYVLFLLLENTSTYYSARLYRATSPQDLSGVTAVFCMCLYHPLYIKVVQHNLYGCH